MQKVNKHTINKNKSSLFHLLLAFMLLFSAGAKLYFDSQLNDNDSTIELVDLEDDTDTDSEENEEKEEEVDLEDDELYFSTLENDLIAIKPVVLTDFKLHCEFYNYDVPVPPPELS